MAAAKSLEQGAEKTGAVWQDEHGSEAASRLRALSGEWLQEHGCPRREFGDVPIPFVWTPDGDGPPEFDLATYGAIDGEPGRYELQWLS